MTDSLENRGLFHAQITDFSTSQTIYTLSKKLGLYTLCYVIMRHHDKEFLYGGKCASSYHRTDAETTAIDSADTFQSIWTILRYKT